MDVSKDDIAKQLSEKGFDAKVIDGVVMIESTDRADYLKMSRILKRSVYAASYGWRMKHGNATE